MLACLDGYMNIAMEQTEEYVNGQLKATPDFDDDASGKKVPDTADWLLPPASEIAITVK